MKHFTSQLQEYFGDRVKLNEPMSQHTNFRIGGPAKWFLEVKTEEELREAVTLADEARVRVVIHGGGSNVLYADGVIDALVLVPAFRKLSIDGTRVTAGAGVLSVYLARKTTEAGLSGLEWMISLPGTVGGAVRGNAGCFGGETKDKLVSVRVGKMENRKWEMEEVSREELNMSYRHSILKEAVGKEWIILSATFELETGDPTLLKTRLDEILEKRKATQPQNVGCAGCTFKNYEIESDEELARLQTKLDIPDAMVKARRLSAGWIIDQLGLKGFAIGGAKVSETHANFLVGEKATADEILQLISVIKTRARNEFGIQLQEEVQFIQ